MGYDEYGDYHADDYEDFPVVEGDPDPEMEWFLLNMEAFADLLGEVTGYKWQEVIDSLRDDYDGYEPFEDE
jgi:hypothetical protein